MDPMSVVHPAAGKASVSVIGVPRVIRSLIDPLFPEYWKVVAKTLLVRSLSAARSER